MKLKLKAPKVVERKTSEIMSEKVSEGLGGDCRIRLKDVEIGMKEGKVYAHATLDAEMDRRDFMKFIKMAMEGS